MIVDYYFIKFLDCKNQYKETIKKFKTYEAAKKWMVKTFDSPSLDFIDLKFKDHASN
jgi:hypothetical protein